MNSQIWKFIAGILASMLLSGAATLHETTGNYATRAEVREAVGAAKAELQAEAKSDHELIKEEHDDVKALNEKIDNLSHQVGELQGMVRARR